MARVNRMKLPTLYPTDRDMSKVWHVKHFCSVSKKYKKTYIPKEEQGSYESRMAAANRIIAELTLAGAATAPSPNANDLTALVQQYFDFKCMGKRNKSIITYRSQVEEFIRWYRTNKNAAAELETLGSNFLSFLAKNGRGNTTINNYRSNLSSIFRAMVKAKKITINPFEYTSKQKEQRSTHEWFRPEQIDELRNHFLATDPQVWLAARLQFYCFIRPCGEMSSLRISDLQLADKRIRIPAGSAKSSGGDEYVLVPEFLIQELEAFTVYPAHYYLFGPNGLPAYKKSNINSLSRRHNNALRLLHYPRPYSFYSWKNTGAVMMIKEGISILHISKLMRHRSLDYTKEYFKSLGFSDINESISHLMPKL